MVGFARAFAMAIRALLTRLAVNFPVEQSKVRYTLREASKFDARLPIRREQA